MSTRTLYCTVSHLWLRLHRQAASGGLLAPRSAWRAEVGLTQRGCDDIGEVVGIFHSAACGGRLERGDELLKIEWEAHRVSSADELYHTKWSVVEREHMLRTPLDATLLELCAFAPAALGAATPTMVG